MTFTADPEILLTLLEQTASKLEINIRYEPILGANNDQQASFGGLCRLHNKNLLIIESTLTAEQKCQLLVATLKRFDLAGVFVPPLVRHMLA